MVDCRICCRMGSYDGALAEKPVRRDGTDSGIGKKSSGDGRFGDSNGNPNGGRKLSDKFFAERTPLQGRGT